MDKFERDDARHAQRDEELIDLGSASALTQGPVQPIVFEPFAFLPGAGIAKD